MYQQIVGNVCSFEFLDGMPFHDQLAALVFFFDKLAAEASELLFDDGQELVSEVLVDELVPGGGVEEGADLVALLEAVLDGLELVAEVVRPDLPRQLDLLDHAVEPVRLLLLLLLPHLRPLLLDQRLSGDDLADRRARLRVDFDQGVLAQIQSGEHFPGQGGLDEQVACGGLGRVRIGGGGRGWVEGAAGIDELDPLGLDLMVAGRFPLVRMLF